MNDYVTTFLWCLAGLVVVLGALSLIGLCRAAARPAPAPPELDDLMRHACVVVAGRRSHEYRVVRDSEGVEWFVCGRCDETVRRAA